MLYVNESVVTAQSLVEVVRNYVVIDDVWSEEYLQGGALLLSSSSRMVFESSAISWMASYGVDSLVASKDLDYSACHMSGVPMLSVSESLALEPGPYNWSAAGDGNVAIRESFALYTDNYKAFLPESTAYAAVKIFLSS